MSAAADETGRSRAVALLALCATAVFWASAFPAAKATLAYYTPMETVFLRLSVAGLCFALVLVPRGRARPADWRLLPRIAVLGLIGVFGYQSLLAAGQTTITASAAGLVITAVPVCTALLAALVAGERLRPPAWAGLALGALGVTVITLNEGLDLGSVRGVGLIILAAGVTAVYFVYQKPVLRAERPTVFLAWAVWISLVASLPVLPGLPERVAAAPLEPTLAGVYLGVFPMALGYGCYTFGLSRLPASIATSFIYLQPPISVLIAWLWLGETPTGLIFAGGALALAGVALVTRYGVGGRR
ncbi:putative cystine transporter YijE [wastewater metagenome]|uniref:Putative cystine transporter YijE n=2 Tax=unclassified sequences TaxID=12908 RepID=A0A5B8R8Y3_9ZZZZ|nr:MULTISPECIES: DMT family transporter [Arhodomonas]MCS4504126.1 DMT family transporter [Arhodomonas aquaeolei]QEA03924.1 putative cystine transporter YijE [uncultured organism]